MKELELKTYDIIIVDLGVDNIGSEQAGIRPAVVIQNNIGNYYSPTTIVLPLTTRIKKLNQPTHVLLKKKDINFLKQDSVVLGEHIRTVDKQRILSCMGTITNKKIKKQILKAFRSIPEF